MCTVERICHAKQPPFSADCPTSQRGRAHQLAMTTPDTFTPVFDTLIQRHGSNLALVYGAMWRFAQMETGACTASYATIACRAGLSRRTVIRYVQQLLRLGLIEDLSPGAAARPHIYRMSVFPSGGSEPSLPMATDLHPPGERSSPPAVINRHSSGDVVTPKESLKKEIKKGAKRRHTPSDSFSFLDAIQNLRKEYEYAEDPGPD